MRYIVITLTLHHALDSTIHCSTLSKADGTIALLLKPTSFVTHIHLHCKTKTDTLKKKNKKRQKKRKEKSISWK